MREKERERKRVPNDLNPDLDTDDSLFHLSPLPIIARRLSSPSLLATAPSLGWWPSAHPTASTRSTSPSPPLLAPSSATPTSARASTPSSRPSSSPLASPSSCGAQGGGGFAMGSDQIYSALMSCRWLRSKRRRRRQWLPSYSCSVGYSQDGSRGWYRARNELSLVNAPLVSFDLTFSHEHLIEFATEYHIVMNHYDALGVMRDAGHATIRAAYHAKLLLLHPDKHQMQNQDEGDVDAPAPESELASIMRAWAVLRDSSLKEQYDRQLELEALKESAMSLNFYDEVNLSDMEQKEVALSSEGVGEGEGEGEGAGGRLKHESTYVMQCRCGDYFRLVKRMVEGESEGGSVSVTCHSCSNVLRVHI